MIRTTTSKRQRKERPSSWLENESLAFVASPWGTILRTKVASNHVKEIFLERLHKEIVKPFDKQKGKRKRGLSVVETTAILTKEEKTRLDRIWNQRIVVGTNQCTRVLERIMIQSNNNNNTTPTSNNTKDMPLLLVLARDIYPPTILSHIPVMVEQINQSAHCCKQEEDKEGKPHFPTLLLPGQASKELGRIFGTKNVSILLFLPYHDDDDGTEEASKDATSVKDSPSITINSEDHRLHETITSFVQFVTKQLVPSS